LELLFWITAHPDLRYFARPWARRIPLRRHRAEFFIIVFFSVSSVSSVFDVSSANGKP
jgi:hypothetical protein